MPSDDDARSVSDMFYILEFGNVKHLSYLRMYVGMSYQMDELTP